MKQYYSQKNGLFEITNDTITKQLTYAGAWHIIIGSNDLLNQKMFPIFAHRLYTKVFGSLSNREKHLINENNKSSDSNDSLFPIIIISDRPAAALSKHFNSIVFNSSIWFRYVCVDCFEKEYKNAISSIEKRKELYKDPNAKEFFEYHLFQQTYNYLNNFDNKGHSSFVTPLLYSDEYKKKSEVYDINNRTDKDGNILPEFHKPELLSFHRATYNILLLDDKPEKGILIKELLSDNKNDEEWVRNTVWDEDKVVSGFFKMGVENYHTKEQVKKDENSREFLERIELFSKNERHTGCTKIFQVTSVKDAILLLSSDKIIETPLRFGLVMLDYLLDKNKEGDREYSTEFFSWFTNNKESTGDKYNLGKTDRELIRAIKDNRGPLQKLWFFPITAFNQTFLDDLRNNGVRLIDYYWHISRGVDPINTPFLFLNSLNNFLYLQLQQAVYDFKTLIKFLEKSVSNLNECFAVKDFQAHMGSEYVVLIQKYGWRSVIKRDADAGSAFSTYIWDSFYKKPENKFLFRLFDKILKFYHQCTYADVNEYDKMMLYLKELDIFITDYWESLDNEYCDRIILAMGKTVSNDERKIIKNADKIEKPSLKIFYQLINQYLMD